MTGREGVRLEVHGPVPVTPVGALPTEPAMPASRGEVLASPDPDPRPQGATFSAFDSQFFLDVRTRAGDLAQVPLVSLPEMLLGSDGPMETTDLRFRVESISGYEGGELAMVWKLRGHVFDGGTRTWRWTSTDYREREPDGYADGRPYWF